MKFLMILIHLAIIGCQQFTRSKCSIEIDLDLDLVTCLPNQIRTISMNKKFNCLAECTKLSNCKAVSLSTKDTICRLYDTSQSDAAFLKVTSIGRNLYFKKCKRESYKIPSNLNLKLTYLFN